MQVRQFYTAPTLIRALEAHDDKFVLGSDRSSLAVLGTVGEPINPRAWNWFFQVWCLSLPLGRGIIKAINEAIL